MAGERGKLTDLQIRHWVKAGVPLAKADGGGLTFTLSAGGSAGWILRYSFGSRRRELTIGRYPDIGLAEARGIATLRRAEVQQGRNPAAEKQKTKATAARDWTVRDLAKDYRAKKPVSLAAQGIYAIGVMARCTFRPTGSLQSNIETFICCHPIEACGVEHCQHHEARARPVRFRRWVGCASSVPVRGCV